MKNIKDRASLHSLDHELRKRIMGRLPMSDKAALGASCRSMRAAWKNYPFSADDYGSTVPHRYIGEAPTPQDWFAVTREKVLAAPGAFPASDWQHRSKQKNAGRVLMWLASIEDRPEKKMARWPLFCGALRNQGRHDEAAVFAAKIAQVKNLAAALNSRSFAVASPLVDANVPLAPRMLSDEALLESPALRSYVANLLRRRGQQSELLYLCERFDHNSQVLIDFMGALDHPPPHLAASFFNMEEDLGRAIWEHPGLTRQWADAAARHWILFNGAPVTPRNLVRMHRLVDRQLLSDGRLVSLIPALLTCSCTLDPKGALLGSVLESLRASGQGPIAGVVIARRIRSERDPRRQRDFMALYRRVSNNLAGNCRLQAM